MRSARADGGLGIDWPSWATRTDPDDREQTSKFSTNFRKTKSDLKDEFRRMGADEWALEDVTGSGGFPGIVVRWRVDGTDYAVACDRYRSKRNNLREAYLWIRETRKRADRPVETGEDEFAAARLPPADEDAIAAPPAPADEPDREPHEILGVAPDAPDEIVDAAFKAQVNDLEGHPDSGGTSDRFQALVEAREAMKDD